MSDTEYLAQSVTRGLIEILMGERNMSFVEALATLRDSKTFALLMDDETHLYRESPSYVYGYLNEELESKEN